MLFCFKKCINIFGIFKTKDVNTFLNKYKHHDNKQNDMLANEVWYFIRAGKKVIKTKLLNDKSEPQSSTVKWNSQFDNINWKKMYLPIRMYLQTRQLAHSVILKLNLYVICFGTVCMYIYFVLTLLIYYIKNVTTVKD